ncbi:MAG TPA: hypothetical protein VMV07_15210 [Streptosporangiaceae bacterium]|nr:hypothetical protein [Streptosporangiaceae bacterium]
MSDVGLFVLVPWVVFAGGVVTVMLLAFAREGRGVRLQRRRDRLRRR